MKPYILLTTSILGLVFFGCKVFNPAMPVENYKYNIPKPLASEINLYADFEVAKLEYLLNSRIDSVLYNDTTFADHDHDNLMLKACKDGKISFAFENNELAWTLPVRLWMKKGMTVLKYKVPFIDSWEYSGNLILRFKTAITVNPDWSITTITTADDYEWVKKPAVKIGNTSVPVTLIANLVMSFNRQSLSKKIDDLVAGNFHFRQLAEKGWKLLFSPLKVEGDYNAWLSINPASVSLMPVQGSLGHIRLGAAVTSEVECLLDRVPQSSTIKPLPEMRMLDSASDSFHINLLTDIPYASINRIISDEMADSAFVFGKRKIIFKSLRVYGSNGKMAVEAKVKGSLNGTLYLTGVPWFNAADTTVRIKELEFDLKTRSLVMSSAKWLFNSKIERVITRSVAVPFNTDVAELESQLMASFNHRPLGYGFELNGKLNRLTVSDLVLAPESIKAFLVFSGNLSLGISEASLSKSDR